jgi:hypothetical protein
MKTMNVQFDHILQGIYGFSRTNNHVSVGADCTMPDVSISGLHPVEKHKIGQTCDHIAIQDGSDIVRLSTIISSEGRMRAF